MNRRQSARAAGVVGEGEVPALLGGGPEWQVEMKEASSSWPWKRKKKKKR